MKKIFFIPIILMMLFTSCETWLDVNESPNSATSTDPADLFTFSLTSYAANRTGGDSHIPIGFMNQSIATGGSYGWGYADDRYDISPYTVGNTWSLYFVSGGNNLNLAIDQAESATPVKNNVAAQCKILLAELVYEASMIYGDIPYFQAWDGDFAYPEFDSQELILNDLLVKLDEAIAQIDLNDPVKAIEGDLVYGGDLAKWIKFANSVKLRIMMTMYDKDPSKASAIAALLSEDLISSADDNFLFPFYDTPENENPKNKIMKKYGNGVNLWFFANSNVFDFMEAYDDPRIPVYFDEGDEAAPGEFHAVETATEADGTSSKISSYLYRADAPEVIFSYSEMLFFQAEIYARGIGVSVDMAEANALYREGVHQAMEFYGVSWKADSTFAADELPDISSMSSEDGLKEIHIQHWVDLMDRSLEAWVQSRRSGDEGFEVPNLQLPSGAPAGGIMRRWPYSNDELSGNINAPTELPQIYDKLWFDK